MPSLPSPEIYYGNPAHFHAAYQSTAIRSAVLLNLGYLPIYFLAVCIYQNPNIIRRYKTTIVFAGITQYVLTLPYTVFNTWLAVYVNQEVQTTVFMCTFFRMGSALLNFISFNSLTAISISRLFIIVFKINLSLAWNMLFFTVASIPIIADVVYMFFVSRPTANSICGPLLFYYEIAPLMLWNGYILGIPLIAVLLNSITAGYLLYKRYSAEDYVKNSHRTVNELFIAGAMLIQSVIPALTMSTKGYRSILETYGGFQADAWVKDLIDTSGEVTTGLNMLASMLCIKHFREMFKQLVLRDNRVARVGETTTITTIMSARYFGQNSTFLSSYRPQASVLSPIFWSNMLPVAFILYCAIKHPKRTTLYTESVLFPTFTQAIMTVPNASYLTWFALFIGQDTPTTVLLCTAPKIVGSSFTLMSFSTITALALSRFITIVFGIRTGIKFTILFSIIIASPLVAAVLLIHFDGLLYGNDVCQPILFLKYEHLPYYHFYSFAVPTLAVLFNFLTLLYLIQYRCRKGIKPTNTTAFDEFYVALSLFVQSFCPLITVGARSVISLNAVNQYGVVIPVEVIKIIDMLGCFTVGLNALVAIIFLKSFRRILIDLLPFSSRQKTIEPISFTSTIVKKQIN